MNSRWWWHHRISIRLTLQQPMMRKCWHQFRITCWGRKGNHIQFNWREPDECAIFTYEMASLWSSYCSGIHRPWPVFSDRTWRGSSAIECRIPLTREISVWCYCTAAVWARSFSEPALSHIQAKCLTTVYPIILWLVRFAGFPICPVAMVCGSTIRPECIQLPTYR